METIASRLGSVSVCACVIALCGASLEAAEPAAGWKAGVARVDTTPDRTGPDGGLRSRTSPSQGVAHPLAAKALALADARGPQGRPRHLRHHRLPPCRSPNRVAERVKAKYGLPREDIVLFASHSHAGPALGRAAPDRSPTQARPRGLREQRRLHARARGQDRRPGRRGARARWSRRACPTASAAPTSP